MIPASDFMLRFPRAHSVIAQGIERGLHTGCQAYVSLNGHVLADCGIGESRPGIPMTADTINVWLSAGKPLTAAAVLQQWERGELRLDDPVARFIPEFVASGKGEVTLRHLLTHTGGFPNIDTGWPDVSWGETIRRICAAPLEDGWIVGRTAGYHTTSSWFILGEVLQRIENRPYAAVMNDRLFRPLGLNDTWAALTSEQVAAYGDRTGWLFAREQGELQLLDWHNTARCAAPSPGNNLRGPIRELGRFYEMLCSEGDGQDGRILSPQTVAAMTARHRVGAFDKTLAHIVDFGLGVIVDSNVYGIDTVPYGYGRYCSARTFGHGGAQSSQGWCDAEAGLVVAYFFNGRPGEGQHNRRARQFNEAIYSDLGLPNARNV
jgi:CubicO group peptidase (beta-lactamase class C family)